MTYGSIWPKISRSRGPLPKVRVDLATTGTTGNPHPVRLRRGDVFVAAEGGSEDTANQLAGTACTAGAGGSAAIGISVTGAGECGESPTSAEIDFSGGGDFGWDVNVGLSKTCVWAPFGSYAGCSNENQDSSSSDQSPRGSSSSGSSRGSSPQSAAPEYGSTVHQYYATSADCPG